MGTVELLSCLVNIVLVWCSKWSSTRLKYSLINLGIVNLCLLSVVSNHALRELIRSVVDSYWPILSVRVQMFTVYEMFFCSPRVLSCRWKYTAQSANIEMIFSRRVFILEKFVEQTSIDAGVIWINCEFRSLPYCNHIDYITNTITISNYYIQQHTFPLYLQHSHGYYYIVEYYFSYFLPSFFPTLISIYVYTLK